MLKNAAPCKSVMGRFHKFIGNSNLVAHNASFDSKFLEEFGEALNELQRNETIRVLIIRSASSKAFCSGVDLSVLENFKSTSEARQFAILLEATMHKLFSFPIPVIANINGLAFGGGFGIALAADIRLMHEGAQGRFPAVQIGAILPISCTIRLNFFLGVSKSKELLLTGRPISARECLDLNLGHFCLSDLAVRVVGKCKLGFNSSEQSIGVSVNEMNNEATVMMNMVIARGPMNIPILLDIIDSGNRTTTFVPALASTPSPSVTLAGTMTLSSVASLSETYLFR